MKKIVIVVLAIILIALTSTLAFFIWNSARDQDISVALNLSGLDAFIHYNKGTDVLTGTLLPSTDYTGGISTEIELWKDPSAESRTIYGHIYMDITTIGPNLANEESLKWAITSNGELLNQGNFVGQNTGNRIELKVDIPLTTTKQLFQIYIWLDESMEINDVIEGETLSTKVWAEATEVSRPTITLTNLGLTKLLNDGTPDFNKIATTDEGIFQTQDDLGISYYFRGASENNYIYFAGFYWRIIRINGDGSIRIIYDGTSAHANGEVSEDRQVEKSSYNPINYQAYIGYMYGDIYGTTYEETHENINNSKIKIANDNWYKANIEDKGYSKYIADAIYCNDRSLYTGTGIGTFETYYQPYNRLKIIKPTLLCTQVNDKFTISENLGNGNLTYPVGLINIDEGLMAGSKYNNKSYYLYTGTFWWTMTPAFYTNSVFFNAIYSDGSITANHSGNSQGLRPVISLKYGLSYTGDGSINNPFKIIEN